MPRASMANNEQEWLWALVYHLKNGPVIVRVDDLKKMMQANTIAESCRKLSRQVPGLIDEYYGNGLIRHGKVELEVSNTK